MRSNKKLKKFKKYFPISIKFYDQRLEVIINNFNYAKQSRLIFNKMQIGDGKNCKKINQQGQKNLNLKYVNCRVKKECRQSIMNASY